MKPNSKILIIAGSDSSGGAGIQADIKTVTALGSYAMTAITAVTIQNTTGVKSIVGINPKEIFNQIVFTCKDIKPDAIKIGMLHSESVIKTVIKSLNKINVKRIILDPVMVAKGGQRLIDTKSIKTLKKKLLKKVTLITPNIPEAEVLSGINIKTVNDMIYAAKKINILGVKSVLVKGGHLETNKIYDVLLSNGKIKVFNSKKIITKNIKEEFGEDFLTVTPGIRPLRSDLDDQSRVSTPEEAVKNGSDYLVIGRPITGSQNPRATLEEINLKIAWVKKRQFLH